MQQEDYLMKQIEQLGKALGKVLADLLNINMKGELEQFEIAKKELVSDLDFNIDELINNTSNVFLDELAEKLVGNPKLYEQLSDVLCELGSFKNISLEDRMLYYSKSLLILEEIINITQTFSINLQAKIENLKVKLENCI